MFINHLPRVVCMINNTTSVLHLGKMNFKKVDAFSRSPPLWVEKDRFEPLSVSL